MYDRASDLDQRGEAGLPESLLKSKALSLCSQARIETPDIRSLYQSLRFQRNVAFASDRMPPLAEKIYGLSGPIPVSYTGFVTARTPSAFVDLTHSSPSERDFYQRLALEVNLRLMDRPLIYKEMNIGRGGGWSVKVGLLVPKCFAKHALDFELNNHPPGDGEPDIILVAHPAWVNPLWEAYLKRDASTLPEIKRGGPPRSLMIFDRENYVAYLLGAMYFGEIKKATLRLGWHLMKMRGDGAPLHASSKVFQVLDHSGKIRTTSFAIAGLSGTGKSTLAMHSYDSTLDHSAGERVWIFNDDALGIIYDPPDRNRGLVGLEENLYNKTDSYVGEGSVYRTTVITAENNLIDRNGRIVYGDALIANGRCESLRRALPIASEDVNAPWPDYLVLIQRNDVMPPIMLLEDPLQIVAYYMSIQTKPTSAENIPFDQIGKLKHVPGANPFICGSMQIEADAILRAIRRTGCKALIVNTDRFIDSDIPKEVTLNLLLQVARNSIEWVHVDPFHGLIPSPDIEMNGFDYAHLFSPERRDRSAFLRSYRDLMIQKIEFLVSLDIDESILDSIRS